MINERIRYMIITKFNTTIENDTINLDRERHNYLNQEKEKKKRYNY